MWALRRTSLQLRGPRNQGLTSRIIRVCSGETEIGRCFSETYNAGMVEQEDNFFNGLLPGKRFYSTSSSFLKSHWEVRTFSSQTDAKSNGEDDDDLDDGFSELERSETAAKGAASEDENDDLSSGSELSEDEGIADQLDAFGTETSAGEKRSGRARSAMTGAILVSPALPVSKVLDKWVQEGNKVTQAEVSLTMLNLRKRRLYVKALQLSEWLESTKHVELTDGNYASRVDLIAKIQGIFKAETYISQIPESFRTELVYRTLLANCVASTNVKKAEQLFNKMKDLGFPVTTFSCNQLLLLYKRTDKKKIADVLLMMEKEDIKASRFTYQILIDVKGTANDISGMEQIVETMKAEGLEPDDRIQTVVARHYANSGLKDKAEAILKEMEGADVKNNRWVYRLLIPIYASLGRADEVERIWKICESDPRTEECMAAIDAWGQLKKVEKAEEVFDKLLEKGRGPTSRHYTCLLKVYANHKMLAKGKDLVKRMGDSGHMLGPLTWDALIKLYVGAGEVEKADSILQKAIKQKRGKPMFSSFMTIMEKYSERGDVHNCEKMFQMMRQAGYSSRVRQYWTLVQAYVKSKTPAYGFSDRLKADNVFPNKSLAGLLGRADPFKKSAVSDLLE